MYSKRLEFILVKIKQTKTSGWKEMLFFCLTHWMTHRCKPKHVQERWLRTKMNPESHLTPQHLKRKKYKEIERKINVILKHEIQWMNREVYQLEKKKGVTAQYLQQTLRCWIHSSSRWGSENSVLELKARMLPHSGGGAVTRAVLPGAIFSPSSLILVQIIHKWK